ncbi:hypothetical protein K440DRAFT_619930 [Wilcoxina mikolae CBS 423.85]|nr:hypothetical protein K440DRAFT_619930 [Wilcoxina mikolae CBS 423.85]
MSRRTTSTDNPSKPPQTPSSSAPSLIPRPRSAESPSTPTSTTTKAPGTITTPLGTPKGVSIVKTPRASGFGQGGTTLGGGSTPLARPSPPNAAGRSSPALKRLVSATTDPRGSPAPKRNFSLPITPQRRGIGGDSAKSNPATPGEMSTPGQRGNKPGGNLAGIGREEDMPERGRTHSRSSSTEPKGPIPGPLSLENSEGGRLFKKAWDRYDPSDTGTISIKDFIPFCRHIEGMVPGAGEYSLLSKEAEELVSVHMDPETEDGDGEQSRMTQSRAIVLFHLATGLKNTMIDAINSICSASRENVTVESQSSQADYLSPGPPQARGTSPRHSALSRPPLPGGHHRSPTMGSLGGNLNEEDAFSRPAPGNLIGDESTMELDLPSSVPIAQSTPPPPARRLSPAPLAPLFRDPSPSPLRSPGRSPGAFSPGPRRRLSGFSPGPRSPKSESGLLEEDKDAIPLPNQALLALEDPNETGYYPEDEHEIVAICTELKRLQKAYAMHEKKIEGMEVDLKEAKLDYQRACERAEQQQSEFAKDFEDFRRERDEAREELSKTRNMDEKRRKQLLDLEEQLSERDAEILKLQNDADRQRIAKTQDVKRDAGAQEKLLRAQVDLSQLQERYRQLDNNFQREQQLRAAAVEARRTLESTVAEKEREISIQKNIIADNEEKIETLTIDCETLQRSLENPGMGRPQDSGSYRGPPQTLAGLDVGSFHSSSDIDSQSGSQQTSADNAPNEIRRHRNSRPPSVFTIDRKQNIEHVVRMNWIGRQVQTDIEIPPGEARPVAECNAWLADPTMAAIEELKSKMPQNLDETHTTDAETQTTERWPAAVASSGASQDLAALIRADKNRHKPAHVALSPEGVPYPADSTPHTTEQLITQEATEASSGARPPLSAITAIPQDPEPVPTNPNASLDKSDAPEHIRKKFASWPGRNSTSSAPLPEAEYTEVIKTTAAKRVQLAAINNKRELTIEDTEFIRDFVVEQSRNPDREILKNVWEVAHRAEQALRKTAAKGYEIQGRGDMMGWTRIHGPLGVFAWPWRMLWDSAFGNLDVADYYGASTRGEAMAKAAIRQELRGEMLLSPTAATTAEASSTQPGAAAGVQPAQTENSTRPDPAKPRRAPVGAQATLLRAGPKPAVGWSILSMVLYAVIAVLLLSNAHMYFYKMRDERAWARANDMSPGWRNMGSCYRVCSDGWGWRWKAMIREWFIEEAGMRWPV